MQQTRVRRIRRSWVVLGACAALWGACKPVPPEPGGGATRLGDVKGTVSREPYGKLKEQSVERYTLRNANGLSLRVISYGAIITEFLVPDRHGKLADVVLGFDSLEEYVAANPYFGAIVGRVANRIGESAFELDGKKYALAANNGRHHLHGGRTGWDKLIWKGEPLDVPSGAALKLTLVSPDGDEGYPGTVNATTIYTLTPDNALKIEMLATTDEATLVNMAHHTYWNLGGHAAGSVGGEVLQLFASQYTPATELVPDGRVVSVVGTPFDFTGPKPIAQDWSAVVGTGYDQNWVVNGDPHQLRPVAKLTDPTSGRTMTLESDQPGVQLYTGNFLDGKKGKGGTSYVRHSGLCLETQAFPNAVNVPEWRDQVILSPGQRYRHTMILRFTTE